MRNYFNYFTEIEEHFVRRRGKNLLISPSDWCLIALWRSSRIPLHVVLRGIDRSFEAALRTRRKPPTTLAYCHPAVVEAFEEFGESRVGAQEESPELIIDGLSPDRVVRFLKELEASLNQRNGEAFERSRDLVASLAEEFEANPGMPLEEVDKSLARVGHTLARALTECLSPDRLKEIQRSVRAELKLYRKRLSKEAYQKLFNSYLERRVREEFELPELSLLDLLESAR